MVRFRRYTTLPPGESNPNTVRDEDKGESFWFWCPGCVTHHRFVTKLAKGEKGPMWTFNGDMDAPTFLPSLNYVGHCHLFVKKGQIEFCTSGTTHDLAGKTVPLPEMP